MRNLLALAALGCVLFPALVLAQGKAEQPAQIDYAGFRGLTAEVDAYRARRLVPLVDFQRMAHEANTIILDARAVGIHLSG